MALLQEAVELKAANPRSYFEMPDEMQAAIASLEEAGMPTVAMISGSALVEQ